MGGLVSTPVKVTSNKDLLDNILKQMFSKADFVDLYSLADPAKCQGYVIVGATALEEMFFKLKIYPVKGDDGVLYFQKISGLQNRLPPEVKAVQQKHCKELAFFFIRVFQIFGALFLSMYDSEFPTIDPDIIPKGASVDARRPFLKASDVFGAAAAKKPAAPTSWFGFGGDLSGASFSLKYGGTNNLLKAYRHFLNKYLVIPGGGSRNFRLGDSVEIPIDSLPPDGNIPEDPNFHVENIQYTFKRNNERDRRVEKYVLTAKLRLNPSAMSNIFDVVIDEFKWQGPEPPLFSKRTDAHTEVEWRADNNVTAVGNWTRFDQVLNNMFVDVVRSIVVPPEISTAKYLRKWNYLTGNYNSGQYIKNTHVYFKGEQEDDATAKVILRTNVKVNEQSVPVEITAKLNIERRDTDSYMVTLDFSDTYIRSSEAKRALDIPEGPQSMLFTLYPGKMVPRSSDDMLVPDFIEKIFKGIVSADGSTKETGFTYRERLGMFEPYNSTSVPDEFKVKGLWKAMVQSPPIKAHCIARASQLLSTQALSGIFKDQAYTSVCRLKFAYQRDGTLPEPNKPITSSAGISALATLFLDTLHDGSPKLTSDTVKWKNFRQQMQELFQLSSVDVGDTKAFASVRGPIVQKTFEFCDKPVLEDKPVPLPNSVAYQLKMITDNLMAQQRAHVSRALGLIFELFDRGELEGGRKLVFNEQLYTRGMARVQEIGDAAITLLTDYYKGCESTYQDGVRIVYAFDASKTVTASAPTTTQSTIT